MEKIWGPQLIINICQIVVKDHSYCFDNETRKCKTLEMLEVGVLSGTAIRGRKRLEFLQHNTLALSGE